MECRLKDISVYYEAYGEGRPLIALHGWSLDHHHMVSALEPLFEHRQGWKRVYPDLPGHGRTIGEDWITNQDQMLDVVMEFIENVVHGERFVLAGAGPGSTPRALSGEAGGDRENGTHCTGGSDREQPCPRAELGLPLVEVELNRINVFLR